MAKDGEKSDGRPPSPFTDPTSPYFLHPSSNPGSVLTQIKLKGENYSAWEQAIILALRSQNKLGFIDGSIATPDKSDSHFVTWEIVNSMLCSWIANSLDDSIRATVSRLSNVKILWECLKNRYSVKNGPKVYKVWSDLTLTKQAGASVMSYYTQFLGMWDDLSNISPLETCTCDSGSSIATWFRNLQTYQFLMGLDDSYSVLRTQIINIEPLPDLDRVYAMVSQEESHRSALQPRDNSPAVGFAVQSKASSSSSSSTTTVSSPSVSSGRPYCTFCERQGHVFDKCWTRLGISPASNRGRGRGRGRHSSQSRVPAFAAAAQWATQTPADAPSSASSSVPTVGIPGLTADQVQRLLALIESSPENDKMSGKISHDVSWLIDSGASHHMTGNISLLSNVRDILPSPVGLPDGEKTSAVKEGSCVIQSGLTLHHVLFVPNLAVNLISVSKLICDANCFVTFTDRLCILQDRTTRSPIGLGESQGGVYHYRPVTIAAASTARVHESYETWHRRLGHPSSKPMSYLYVNGNKVVVPDHPSICDICCRAKQTRSSFPISNSCAKDKFDLIHCDIWGPYRKSTISGATYFLTIVDDFSRAVWVYLLLDKGEASLLLRQFCAMVKTQFEKSVKMIRSDNGLEFTSTSMTSFYGQHGIIQQTSLVDAPQQNGCVERKHRHVLEVARALLFQASLPIEFWGECVLTAAHLINRTPTPLLNGLTPHDKLFSTPPNFTHLRVFGCLCYAHYKDRSKDKFSPRSRRCVFLGYPHGKKGWKVMDLESKKMIISRDVKFDENTFPFATSQSQSSSTPFPTIIGSDWSWTSLACDNVTPFHELGGASVTPPHTRSSTDTETPLSPVSAPSPMPLSDTDAVHRDSLMTASDIAAPSLGRGHRVRKPPSHLHDYVCHTVQVHPPSSRPSIGSSGTRFPLANYVTYQHFSSSHSKFLGAITAGVEPHSFNEAMQDPHWRQAMQTEIEALERNGTWTITDLPPGKKPIGCKWVYKLKYKSDGTIERHKARLVVRGDTQVEGLDFDETFAPVAKLVSVRLFLTVAVIKGWELHQLDINNAFLHGDLHEEVYMRFPPGFSTSHPNKVCRLQKSLYGLRQSPRNWFAKLTAALRRYGFIQSHADHTLFTYRKADIFLSVLVYVDDLIVAGNNSQTCASFKSYLNDCFQLKDLGTLKYFLGIEAARNTFGLFLCQRKYTLDILKDAGLLGAKPAVTPMEQNHNLARASGHLLHDPGRYRRLVGRLVYLSITRPDICYAVHILTQFLHEPRQEHMDAVHRVLRYLKGSPGQGILLRSDSSLQLYAFCDSDWAACPLTRRSLTAYFINLGSSPISWKTKKQPTVARSSAEAEYRALAVTTCELTWIKSFLASLGVFHSHPMRIYCDNQAALHIASNPVFHERTKHIEVDCHYVREQLVAGNISTSYIQSSHQPADILTKALGHHQFKFLLGKLGVRNPHAPP